MDRKQLDQMIAELEEQQREAAKVLPHLRAARAALDGDDSTATSAEAGKAEAAAKGNGHSGKQTLFEAKYDKPGRVLILDLLRSLEGKEVRVGLSRRGVRENLAARGTSFSSQFITYALRGLEEEGAVEKIPAPSDASAKWNFRANPDYRDREASA